METLDLDLGFEPIDIDATPTPEPETNDNTEVVENAPSDNEDVVDTPTEDPTEDEQEPTDGRKLPDEVRKALKALRDSSPENAKAARALNDVYGREQAYKQLFPSVKDAQAAQSTIQTIESFGGLETIQSSIAEIAEIDQMLQSGDIKVIEKIFEVSGEGFGTIAPAMLDKLQSSNPDVYAATIRPHLVSAIGASGLTDAFAAVIQAQQFAATPGASPEFKAKWEKDAATGLQKIHEYLSNLGKQQATPPAAGGAQPDKLSQREQALAAREAEAFKAEVGAQANAKMNTSLANALNPYLRGVKLDNTARAEFTQSVYNEVAKLAKADKVYQSRKDALFASKTRKADDIAKHMAAKFDSVVGQATKTVAERPQWKALLSNRGARPAAGSTAAPASGGTGSAEKPILVKELPSRNEIDWNKTTDDMTMRGIRVLKSGKVIRLDR